MKKICFFVMVMVLTLTMLSCTGTSSDAYGDSLFHEGLLSVRNDDGYWGAINTKGELVIDTVYGFLSPFYDSKVAIIREADIEDDEPSYNIIDLNENKLLAENLFMISPFYAGYATFGLAGEMGIMNSKGEIVTEQTFEQITYTQYPGIFQYQENNLVGLIDETGTVIAEAKYDSMMMFSGISTLTYYELDSYKGVVNVEGVEILPNEYTYIHINYIQNNITAKKDGLWGLFDEDGNTIVEPISILPIVYTDTEKTGKNIATYIDEENQFGIINENGEIISTFQAPESNHFTFDMMNRPPIFEHGVDYLQDSSGMQYAVIDQEGSVLVEAENLSYINDLVYSVINYTEQSTTIYDYEQNEILSCDSYYYLDLEDGYPNWFTLYQKVDDNYIANIYNYDGVLLHTFSVDDANSFVFSKLINGYRFYGINQDGTNLYGFLDKDANIAIEAQFDLDVTAGLRVGFYADGYALLYNDGKYGVIDKEGNIISDFEYSYVYPTFYYNIEDRTPALDWLR